MKKKLLTAFIVAELFISKVSVSQVNSYLQNSPVWNISSVFLRDHDCLIKEFYNYYTNGDILINSLVYKKVYRKGYYFYTDTWNSYSVYCPGPGSYISTSPQFFLRSAGKKMFVIFSGSNSNSSEQLLYDFNLHVGDTLPLSAINSATKYYSDCN